MNLVDLVKDQLGGQALGQISDLLGTSNDQARGAVNAAVPTILAGLSQLASTPDGARRVASAVENADEGVASNLAGSLTGGASSLVSSGSNILTSLFGNNTLSSIGSILSKFTGLGSTAVMSLLGALAPSILGLLKGQQRNLGLDAGGISNLLAGQRLNIVNAMPSGLGQVLNNIPGLGALGSLGGKAAAAVNSAGNVASNAYDATRSTARQGANAAASAGSSAASWGIPLLAVLGLLGLLWWALSGISRREAPQASIPAPPPAPRIDQAMPAAARIPSMEQVNGVRDDVAAFFKSSSDTFASITDAASAQAALPQLRELVAKTSTLQSSVSTLPADSKSMIQTASDTALSKLQPAIDRINAIPGISDTVRPVLAQLIEKLKALAGRPVTAAG